MTQLILNIASIAAGILGLFLAIYSLYQQLMAERHLSQLMKERSEIIQKNAHIFLTRDNDMPPSEDQLRELVEDIKRLTDEMPISEKDQILESLEQKSPKGRMNYLKRLLDNANVGMSVNA